LWLVMMCLSGAKIVLLTGLGAVAPGSQAVPVPPRAHGQPGAGRRHDRPAAGLIGQWPGRR
jgi:hypothetical protein